MRRLETRWQAALPALVATTFALAACGPPVSPCTTDDYCRRGDTQGTCAPSPSSPLSFCAFADPSCTSGARWDESAGDDLASTCTGDLPDGAMPANSDGGTTPRDLAVPARPDLAMPAIVDLAGAASVDLTSTSPVDLTSVTPVDLTSPAPVDLAAHDLAAPTDLAGHHFAAVTIPVACSFFAVWGASASSVWAVGANGCIAHFDGSTWTRQTSNTTVSLGAVWGSSATDVYAVGDSGTVLHSSDGTQWSAGNVGGTVSLTAVVGTDAAHVVAGGGQGIAWQTVNGGASWTARQTAIAKTLNALLVTQGALVALSYGGAMTRSTDGGTTWSGVASVTTADLYAGTGGGTTFAVGSAGTVLTSSNAGVTWTVVTSAWPSTSYLTAAAVGGGELFVSDEDGLTGWRAASGGAWQTEQVTPAPNPLHGLWAASASDAWLVGNSPTFYRFHP